jgi:hypothetical protein
MFAACTATQLNSAAAYLQSPAGQSLVTGVENFNPSVAAIVSKLNAGVAASAADVKMACGYYSYASALGSAVAPGLTSGSTATAANAGVETVCAAPPADTTSAAAIVLQAAANALSAAQAAGAPVTTPAAK